jgi:hypothetical protein
MYVLTSVWSDPNVKGTGRWDTATHHRMMNECVTTWLSSVCLRWWVVSPAIRGIRIAAAQSNGGRVVFDLGHAGANWDGIGGRFHQTGPPETV